MFFCTSTFSYFDFLRSNWEEGQVRASLLMQFSELMDHEVTDTVLLTVAYVFLIVYATSEKKNKKKNKSCIEYCTHFCLLTIVI